jgi:dephospho-CoA kinase
MLKVGLTGSIAVGKSHVLSLFRGLGCQSIDADHVAREVVQPCRAAYHEIVSTFGAGVLAADGFIDRARLGKIVFDDSEKRQWLNAIVHPRVMEEIEQRISRLAESDPDGIVVVDGALIIEAGVQEFFDTLIVVFCNPDAQIKRLMRRDRLSRELAMKRIQAQMSSEEKRAYADFEIDTSGSFKNTRRQVEQVYQALRKIKEGTRINTDEHRY